MRSIGEDLLQFIKKFNEYSIILHLMKRPTHNEIVLHTRKTGNLPTNIISEVKTITDILPIYDVEIVRFGYLSFIPDNYFIHEANSKLKYRETGDTK